MRIFPQEVEKYIIANRLISSGCQIIVGVSGGADSMALLLILYSLRKKYDLNLIAAHLNHGLRDRDSDADADFVRGWCSKLNLDFVLRHCDVRQIAKREKIGLEAAGRNTRREFFADLVSELQHKGFSQGNIRIALAHHMDDQAESLLLHLGRGSGLDGLVGMRPQMDLFIRPLLDQSRNNIETWLREEKITWRTDASNNQPITMRNRLRLNVLPIWQEALGYNPAPALARTAVSMREDQDYLNRQAQEVYTRTLMNGQLQLSILNTVEPALISRVLRLYWSEQTGSASDITMIHINELRKIIRELEGVKKVMLPHKWTAIISKDCLCLERSGEEKIVSGTKAPQIGYALNLPGDMLIPEMNLQINALLIENESKIVYNNAMECFRLEDLNGCRIRYRLPGDRIHPLGRNCGKSLKKLFNEKKVPTAERDKIPLLARGQEVIWLPGYASGASAVRPGDRRNGQIVCLKISWLEPVR